ncbi:hypothetical protein FN846DRAFT_908119 [Sphaerosporella brunnea]|uniref:Uncharacterized protein n=1 Tax=Sphaerosporella brunnea TaxID=1250544 RepID=A0A5J5EU19_9PEZI|nr:hypothetical protein FN846DRAFT_908119 [Sphaerosporella brunnea]
MQTGSSPALERFSPALTWSREAAVTLVLLTGNCNLIQFPHQHETIQQSPQTIHNNDYNYVVISLHINSIQNVNTQRVKDGSNANRRHTLGYTETAILHATLANKLAEIQKLAAPPLFDGNVLECLGSRKEPHRSNEDREIAAIMAGEDAGDERFSMEKNGGHVPARVCARLVEH